MELLYKKRIRSINPSKRSFIVIRLLLQEIFWISFHRFSTKEKLPTVTFTSYISSRTLLNCLYTVLLYKGEFRYERSWNKNLSSSERSFTLSDHDNFSRLNNFFYVYVRMYSVYGISSWRKIASKTKTKKWTVLSLQLRD